MNSASANPERPATPSRQAAPRLRVAVIGGGISGLSAAYELVQLRRTGSTPVDITVYEAGSRWGGVFGTVRQDDYLIETGADMFITNKPGVIELVRELGLENQLIETDAQFRRSLILRRGRPVPTPTGFDLMVPRQLTAFLKSPLLSWRGKLRVLSEMLIPAGKNADPSLQEFAVRRFGREAFERIIQPMVGGIYTADPELLSLRATLPRFLDMEAQHGSLLKAMLREKTQKSAAASSKRPSTQQQAEVNASGARYGLFLSFAAGMSVLQETLVKMLQPECRMLLQQPIVELQTLPAGTQRLINADGSAETFDAVLLTLPAPPASQLLRPAHAPLAELLGGIPYASAAIAISGYRLDQVTHPLDAFGLVIPAQENRRILAVSIPSRKFPGRAPAGRVQLRTFIGGALQQPLLEQTDAQLLQMVETELQDIFGISGPPELTRLVRWNQAMPQYHVGHVQRVEQIRQAVQQIPGLELAGNAYSGVGLPDVIESARSAARRLWSQPQLISSVNSAPHS